jgi:hypothetical protein
MSVVSLMGYVAMAVVFVVHGLIITATVLLGRATYLFGQALTSRYEAGLFMKITVGGLVKAPGWRQLVSAQDVRAAEVYGRRIRLPRVLLMVAIGVVTLVGTAWLFGKLFV